MAESRVRKSLLNAKVNLVFYVLTLALAFFSRKTFLDCLGADFVGLTGTLQNLLGFLNLAELGVGAAIGYVLYKPLFDNDRKQINEIISVFGYLYRWIGFIILALGVILACFLPLIFPNTGFELGVIYSAYFAFLASSLIGYFINFKQTLLGADQRNYVVTGYFQTCNIVKILIQMASARYTGSYYLWVAIELGFGIVYSFILNWRIRVVYPWLNAEIKQGSKLLLKYNNIAKYIKQLMIHKIAVFSQYQTTPFISYIYTSLEVSAVLGNYTMIADKVSMFLGNILSSTDAGVGNLVAEGNESKIEDVFWELFAARVILAGTVSFAIWKLITPFIIIWLGSGYILSDTVVLIIVAKVYIGIERGATTQFLFAYGLFWDVWAPISESLISVIGACICGYFFGIEGVLCGSLLSLVLVIELWKPIMLYRWGFKKSVFRYWKHYFMHIAIMSLAWCTANFICDFVNMHECNDYFSWSCYGLFAVTTYGVLIMFLFYVFTPYMEKIYSRLKSSLKQAVQN